MLSGSFSPSLGCAVYFLSVRCSSRLRLPVLPFGRWSNTCLPLTLQLPVDTALPFPSRHLRIEIPVMDLYLPLPCQWSPSTSLLITSSLALKLLAPAACFSSPLQAPPHSSWLQLSSSSLTASNHSNNDFATSALRQTTDRAADRGAHPLLR